MAPSAPEPGVDPSVEGHHQHGAVEGPVPVPLVEGHGAPASLTTRPSVRSAISASRTTLRPKPSTLERSPAAAPPT